MHTTRLIAEVGLRFLGGLTTSGEENIRNIEGPYVQAAKHTSMLDIPVTGLAAHRVDRQHLHYQAKDNMDLPFIGWWLSSSGTMFLNRKAGLTPDNHADIARRADKNAAFITWPEGHRYRGPLKREHIMKLVIVPLVFEHSLTVVPAGIAGTEPGDIGFFHVAYGEPFTPEKIDFEADPNWETRKRTGMLTKAIRAQLGKDSIDAFMEDLYQGMSKADAEAAERHRERQQRRQNTKTILFPLNALTGRTKERTLNL
jgi:1-acyl-sn-glycerol-3-phosphate acyltransferase